VGALVAARRNAELALNQAAYEAARKATWRDLAAAGIPVQTFHRRYSGRPDRLPPRDATPE
jgi:hypothetical protein